MKVQKFLCNYGDGESAFYVVFASGEVMYAQPGDAQYRPSKLTREDVFEDDEMEFLGWIDAPCVPRI